MITIGIDASSLRAGGGFNHLVQLLRATDPAPAGINKIVVWCNQKMFQALPALPWLERISVPQLERNILFRSFWRQFSLPRALILKRCDLLFSPGGLSPYHFSIPTVVMSRNMLPFEPKESHRYPMLSYQRLRLWLLRMAQSRSMSQSAATIFLTDFSKKSIIPQLKKIPQRIAVIPHGIDPRFLIRPRPAVKPDEISRSRPFRFLYVSTVDLYKHQWNVAKAAKSLVERGVSIQVEFIGAAYIPALRKLRQATEKLDPGGEFLHYRGELPFQSLHEAYRKADVFLFASSCENLPNILIEAMASGLPIACSNRGPMPELLGEAGVYFDPENPAEIANRMRELIMNPDLRGKLAEQAHQRAREYSWKACADRTFSFIGELRQ